MARKIAVLTDRRNLVKRGGVWYVKRMENGALLVQSTGETDLARARARRDQVLNPFNLRDEKERAEAVLSRVSGIERQLAEIQDAVPSTSIRHGWQAFLDRPNRPDSGAGTLQQYEFQYEAFARWAADTQPEAGELRHVSQAMAEAYAGHLQKTVGPSTFNRHMNLLSLVWRVLEDEARITVNPWRRIARKRVAVRSRRELTADELRRLCGAARGEMRVLLALGIFCGLRLGDAACLTWGSVDLLRGVISVEPMKTARRTHKRVSLPIHRTLARMLEEIPPEKRRGHVLPDTAAAYMKARGTVCEAVQALFAEADIKTNPGALTRSEREAIRAARAEGRTLPGPSKPPKPPGRRFSPEAGFHSLRHTFVSLCAAGGVPQAVVQSLVGHGSPAMTRHYTHIGLETARKAVDALPDVTQPTTTSEGSADAPDAEFTGFLTILAGMDRARVEAVARKCAEMLAQAGTPKGVPATA